MAMVGSEIERLIRQAFPDAHVIVVDMAGDGTILPRVSPPSVQGKEPDPAAPDGLFGVAGANGGALHALALETSVPK